MALYCYKAGKLRKGRLLMYTLFFSFIFLTIHHIFAPKAPLFAPWDHSTDQSNDEYSPFEKKVNMMSNGNNAGRYMRPSISNKKWDTSRKDADGDGNDNSEGAEKNILDDVAGGSGGSGRQMPLGVTPPKPPSVKPVVEIKEVIKIQEVIKEVPKIIRPEPIQVDMEESWEDLEDKIDLMQVQFIDFLHGEATGTSVDTRTKPYIFGGSLESLDGPFDYRTTWKKILSYTLQTSGQLYNRSDYVQMGRKARSLMILDKVLHDRPDLHLDLIFIEPKMETLSSSAGTVSREEPKQPFQRQLNRRATDNDNAENSDTIPLLRPSRLASLPKSKTPTEKSTDMHLFLFRKVLSSTVRDLTIILHPYLFTQFPGGIRDLQSKFSGKGLVISTGKWHFKLAYHAILSLRQVLKCDLPIEVMYAGPHDLEPSMIESFNAIEGVRAVDIWDYFPEESRTFSGWSVKPFAMLASSFEEILFMDADALFLQDPKVLFEESNLYKRDGALFFFDRTMKTNEQIPWLKSYLKFPSKYSMTNRYMTRRSIHEMESGVVVMNKGRADVLHALLAVCKMNSKYEREKVTYKNMHGDKESFWMSFDLLRSPYAFVPSYAGTIGYKNPYPNPSTGATGSEICGGLFHTDENMKPLWWNGGVLKNKHADRERNYIDFEMYAFDLTGEVRWIWETAKTPFCLMPKNPEREVKVLEEEYRKITREYVRMFDELTVKEGKK
ncbi:hypothetical protein HDV05_000560 [Chytridiales sp. JEL 0842]|nr:hypothetical protein HDV05_000560 [Chytridiales sp. JEL 0842]